MRTLSFLATFTVMLFASAQSGRIHVYFNQATDHSVSSGTDAITLGQAMDDTIEAYIDRAQYTIDVAMYNADDFSIMYALNDARDRGVQVRYIAEGTTTNSGLNTLSAAIPVLFRTDGQGSGMHNKFMSIDADHADQAWVWSGSTNWTQSGLFQDFNNMIFIQDQALALAYRTEFEEMWGGSGAQPNVGNSKFGAAKTNNTPHSFMVDGVQVESYFSPSDGTTSHLVSAINGAEHTVRVAMFAFTNYDLGTALLNADQRPNTEVHMDLEDPIAPGDEGWYLFSNGVDVVTHNTDDVQLHHKYAVIDEGSTDDPLVITGSHNWTYYAETVNDENTLIVHDATIANQYYQEWHARHNDVASVADVRADEAPMAWPVPASAELHVALSNGVRNATVSILDLAGRTLLVDRSAITDRTLNVTVLSEGAYVLVCTLNGRSTQRLFAVAR